MLDAFEWYCEQCGRQVYREEIAVQNIVTDLPKVFERYYGTPANCTCKHCGTVMQPPVRR
jgi:3-hydroxyanthranilate 3,4-dioxygenase